MQALSASKLLKVWEQGRGEPPYRRALLLLAAACPDDALEELSSLSVGCRDRRLLSLREWTFGPRLDSLAVCPACAARLEFGLNVPDLQARASKSGSEHFQLVLDGYAVEFYPPSTHDLIEVAQSGDNGQTGAALMERCVWDARREGTEVAARDLPPQVFEALAARVAQVDPLADIELALLCPACAHRWHVRFDIVSFFWSEIDAWAVRTLREVHLLASAYGWRETDILALSPSRRGLYLEMVA